MTQEYYSLLSSAERLPMKALSSQIHELHMLTLAKYLKRRFNDDRSLKELRELIKEELGA